MKLVASRPVSPLIPRAVGPLAMSDNLPDPPQGWGEDEVTVFLDAARGNSFATFANLPQFFEHLVVVDSLFRKAIPQFTAPDDVVPGLLLLRCHGAYLAAIRLSISGQHPETYSVLRTCLEIALYANHMRAAPSLAEVWLKRSEGLDERRAAEVLRSGPNGRPS